MVSPLGSLMGAEGIRLNPWRKGEKTIFKINISEAFAVFAFAVANFHLTAFASDFRRNHRLMNVHKHSYGITPGEKTGRK
jgi:hypothetical protein